MGNKLDDPDRIVTGWLRECRDERVTRLFVDRLKEVISILHLQAVEGHEEWIEVGGTNVTFCLQYGGQSIEDDGTPGELWYFVDINPGLGSEAALREPASS